MRVRDHILLSTAGAAILGPPARGGKLGLWAGGVLVDVDHYVCFCLRERRLNPAAAVRFFNQPDVPQQSSMRPMHTATARLGALVLGLRQRRLMPFALGMYLHVALDERHEARMRKARTAALARDQFTCRGCGTRSAEVGTHVWHQPLLLPDYGTQNIVSLCGRCHEAEHAQMGIQSWR